MALALRGWGRDEFETASPDFLEAARFALFAERLAPLVDQLEEVIARPVTKDLPTPVFRQLMAAKSDAERLLPAIRSALYPEDEPVG